MQMHSMAQDASSRKAFSKWTTLKVKTGHIYLVETSHIYNDEQYLYCNTKVHGM